MKRSVIIPAPDTPSFLREEMEITVGPGCGVTFLFRKKRNEDIYFDVEMTLDDFADAMKTLGLELKDH